MLKFKRNFKLTIDDTKEELTFMPPLRIVFECSKGIYGSQGNMNLKIYNLTRSNATRFAKDPTDQKILNVTLEIGYQDDLQIVFKGFVYRGFVSKEGVDTAVNLQVIDGGSGLNDVESFVSATVGTKEQAFKTIVNAMPGVSIGKIAQQEPTVRAIVLCGNAVDCLKEQIDPEQNWFIDNGKLYVLGKNDVLSGYVPVVSPETGLENSPERENYLVNFSTRLNPALRVGGLCKLISTTAEYLNGVYKIQQIVIRGDNYGQEWGQLVTGIYGAQYKEL
jgi:hypothetical protein